MSTMHENSQFSHQDLEIKEVEDVYQGFFKLQRYTLRHRLYQGGWSNWIQREMMDRGHAAGILLFDPKLDQVVLVEQFRIGAVETGSSPWLLEIVAGMLDSNQAPLDVAVREAQEEAGLSVKRVIPCNSFLPGAGGLSERIHLFIGEVDASSAGGVHGLDNENEDILVKVLSREQAFQAVQAGIIDNAAAVITIQWLQLNLQKVLLQWQNSGRGDER
ncbi:ADP-ribose diphosphatase [Agarivorans sp. MS3-6]|uniref:ADP-ribose diphosphatase n=1 Tax=Agarivorans sp. TSD2052 TaxID=2937286 RepID=UPI00200F92CF|nr:ADP-ribose diphosphatase [Agarivorans sp. TSD2052]UPW19391.1 ADP-ribose diphosphatase [Agarivorans sp. TSD2052]